MLDTVETARELFAKRGLSVGIVIDIERHEFESGGECHSVTFGNGRVHFHFGRNAWLEYCEVEWPELRIRSMEYNGEPIAEPEWFAC
jgi:hypothetical protein